MLTQEERENLFRLSNLIADYLADNITEEQRNKLSEWLSESEANRTLFKQTCSKQTMAYKIQQYQEEDVEGAFHAFLNRRKSTSLRRRIYWWSACAAVILLVGISWLFMDMQNRGLEYEILTTENILNHEKSQYRPVLTLPTGERLLIHDDHLMFEESAIGQKIMIGNKTLHSGGESANNREGYNIMDVPPMCDFHFTLSDGTKVWMNAASNVRYPERFSDDSRTIYVSGEIYLEVANDIDRPFYVVLDNMEVEVLGTSFNVRAYEHERETRVTLVEGSVSAHVGSKKYTLTPGKQLCLEERYKNISIRDVDVDDVLAWKRGFYVFKKSLLTDVASTLKTWYNVEILMTSDVSAEIEYTGVVNKEEPIEVFLRRLEEVSNVKCDKNGNIIIIY